MITVEDADALQDASRLVADESGDLADDPRVRLGQVVAALAAEYLGTR